MRSQLRFVVGLLRGSWGRIVLLFLLPIAALEGGVVLAARQVVGHAGAFVARQGGIAAAGLSPRLILLAALVLAFFVIRAVAVSSLWHRLMKEVADVQVDLGSRLFGSYLYRPYDAFVADERSRMLETLRAASRGLLLHLLRPVLTVFSELLVGLAIVGVLLAVAPLATLLLLGWMALAFGIMTIVTLRLSQRYGSIRWSALHDLRQVADYAFREIRMVRQSGAEARLEADFRQRSRGFADAVADDIALSGMPRHFGELAVLSSVMLLGLLFLHGGAGGGAVLGDIVVFAVAGLRLLPVAQRLIGVAQQFRNNAPDLGEVIADLHAPRLDLPAVVDRTAAPFERAVTLVDIGFRYATGPWVVRPGTNLTFMRGEWLQVSGPSGAGKSTLLTLLLGFLSPQQGHIEIDGVARAPLAWFRGRSVAIVPQEPGLIGGSVADNLAFPFPRGHIDRLRARAILVDLGLSDDLDADIGDEGIGISGGQRQRIAIARALLTAPAMLVLDEATSQLDSENEAQVWSAIRRYLPDVTLIVVAHRLSHAAGFDRTWTATDGAWTSVVAA